MNIKALILPFNGAFLKIITMRNYSIEKQQLSPKLKDKAWRNANILFAIVLIIVLLIATITIYKITL